MKYDIYIRFIDIAAADIPATDWRIAASRPFKWWAIRKAKELARLALMQNRDNVHAQIEVRCGNKSVWGWRQTDELKG